MPGMNSLDTSVPQQRQCVDNEVISRQREYGKTLLNTWNNTRVEFPNEKGAHQLFEEQAEKTPDAIAVEYEYESLSYGELNRRANQLSHYLRRLGVRPDVRVAICVERSLKMAEAVLGVLKAGGAYVPLDPGYPAERLRFMLEDSAPAVLLTQDNLRGRFSRVPTDMTVLDLTAAGLWKEEPLSNPDPKSVGFTSEDLAYVIYTSGSTGVPKGVMLHHRGLCNLVVAQGRGFLIEASSRILQFSSFSFDACVWEMVMALCRGACLHLPRRGAVLSGEDLIEIITTHGITHATLPPAVLAALPEQASLDSLRTLILAGDTLGNALIKRWAHGRQVINAYGPTEGTVCATMHECLPQEAKNPPIGRPIANMRVYILDEAGEPVPAGVVGELYIGGEGVARGYLNRPDLTADRFRKDLYSENQAERMYKTGDLGRWLADGEIEFLGRNDFQVKIRGFRIELGEIESRLGEYPGVNNSIVVAREDDSGEKRLVAYYTGADAGTAPRPEQLRSHIAQTLPEYMVPAAYMRLDQLPLTDNGKLDRNALPAPEADAYAIGGYEAPQGEIETVIAGIWTDLLKIPRVGRHDNFFALGGHSLLAVTLMERIRRCGFELDVRALFATPTVAGLVASFRGGSEVGVVPENRIRPGCKAITPPMLPLVKLSQEEIDTIISSVPGGAENVQDIYPLTPLQEGILFHHLMGRDGDPYMVGMLASFVTRTRLDEYVHALQAVIDRHDILRTAVMWEMEPLQVVLRKALLRIEEVKLEEAAEDMAQQLWTRFDPRGYQIDVQQAPLLRVYIAEDKAKGRWLMLLLLHHLAGDHTTLDVIQEEVGAHFAGEAGQLPSPMPFRNLVAEARLGMSQEEHEAFFRQMLGDVREPTAPCGLTDVQGNGSGMEEARIMLDTGVARRLRERARQLGVSAASVCHLAWARVLSQLSGRKDVVFGTVLFGRMRGGSGGDRVMGLFINTLPVRIKIGSEGVEASVRATHQLLGELLRHEHAALALAQRCSGVPAGTPLFSALLNYIHTTHASSSLPQKGLLELRAWEGMQWLHSEERTNYPFVLSVDDLGADFWLSAQVRSGVDPKQVCELMESALESLVKALETSPEIPVFLLNAVPEQEQDDFLANHALV